MSDAHDWAALGLLEGLDDAAAAERAELLDWLAGRGFGLEELRRGSEDGLLPFLPAERLVMGGPPALTGREAAARTGTSLDLVQAIRRAQGLPVLDPDETYFAERELGAVAMPRAFAALGLSEEQILTVSRVLGRGLAQAAQVMRATVLEMSLEPGLRERELAERYEATVELVLPHVGPLLENVVRMHLRDMVRAEAVDATLLQGARTPGEVEIGVAFADLVGFTRMGEEVPAEEVGRIAERLEVLAGQVVGGPVRLVKTIGDAVMLVSSDAAALALAGLELVDVVQAEGEGLPQLRVGLAHGPAFQRGGDWFGSPVNLASRMTSLARTGSVLAAETAHAAADGDGRLRWSFAGERRVKGLTAPVKTFRARRADDAAS